MEWLGHLKQRTDLLTNDEQQLQLYARITDIALLCCSTFDVEDRHFKIVFGPALTISLFLECSIKVRENCGSRKPETGDRYHFAL
jgi:hypothetical protein